MVRVENSVILRSMYDGIDVNIDSSENKYREKNQCILVGKVDGKVLNYMVMEITSDSSLSDDETPNIRMYIHENDIVNNKRRKKISFLSNPGDVLYETISNLKQKGSIEIKSDCSNSNSDTHIECSLYVDGSMSLDVINYEHTDNRLLVIESKIEDGEVYYKLLDLYRELEYIGKYYGIRHSKQM